MQTVPIRVDDVEIGERHRALSDEAVSRLAESMKDIGLKQPITVRIVEEMELDGVMTAGVPVLVAGRHRLEAARRIGWSHIDCIEIDDDVLKAELWELAENLHRCDLTKDQRDQHIRRYAELLAAIEAEEKAKPGQSVLVSDGKGGRGKKSVATKIAEKTGLSAKTVKRALNPPTPPPPAPSPQSGMDVVERQLAGLMIVWNRTGPEARARFLAEIGEAA